MITGIKWIRISIISVICIMIAWFLLTMLVEGKGPSKIIRKGASDGILITYDPDPIYDLDFRICQAFGDGLLEDSIKVTIATIAAADTMKISTYRCVVICANTYNWAPDWAVCRFIENSRDLKGKPVVAIVVGSGTTSQAARKLEKKLRKAGAITLLSREWWLLRPNDESGMQEKNADVAVAQAHLAGVDFGRKFNAHSFQKSQ